MKHPSTSAEATRAHNGENKSESARQVLIEGWLRAYGVQDPRDLDLGTLQSIGEFVRDGIAPGDLPWAVGI